MIISRLFLQMSQTQALRKDMVTWYQDFALQRCLLLLLQRNVLK